MKMALGTCHASAFSWHVLLPRTAARFSSHVSRRSRIHGPLRTMSSSQASCETPNELRFSRVPLVERSGKHISTTTEVLMWRQWARAHAALKKLDKSGLDDLPSLTSLHTEIDWIVGDAIAATRPQVQGQRQSVWAKRVLIQVHEIPPEHDILLRESLPELRFSWLKRLRERVPLQYITSTCFWRDLTLVVSPAVLIPRPETELMVEHVKGALTTRPVLCRGPWVDLGTGSGALAISVAAEILKTRTLNALEIGCSESKPLVHAVDISSSSVQIARCNISRYDKLAEGGKLGVQVHQGSWFEPLELQDIVHDRAGTLAGIISNPPYISSNEMRVLQPEVRYHEPWLALESGKSGVEALEVLCKGASRYLLPGGFLLLETGGGDQVTHVVQLLHSFKKGNLRENGGAVPIFENIQIHADHRGFRRFISAWKC